MAATRSSPSTSTPSSLASRRPQARTALPPFTLPPQPGVPRAAADTLSPPTPASAYGSTPRQSSASPSYSAESSPGYSTGTTMLAHPHRAASHSPYQSHHPLPAGGAAVQPRRLAPRPGPLTHPHDPKVTSIAITNAIANTAGISANRDTAAGVDVSGSTSPRSPSARRPLPGAPGETSPTRPVQRLPPISSLISPLDRAGLGRVRIMHVRPWERPLRPAPVQFQVSPIIQDRPFPCDMCSQRFSRNHDLKRHKRIHIAAKPFPCPTCDKKFSRSDALKRHRLVKACHIRDGDPTKQQPPSAGAEAPPVPPQQVEREASPESEPPEPPASSGSTALSSEEKEEKRKSLEP